MKACDKKDTPKKPDRHFSTEGKVFRVKRKMQCETGTHILVDTFDIHHGIHQTWQKSVLIIVRVVIIIHAA